MVLTVPEIDREGWATSAVDVETDSAKHGLAAAKNALGILNRPRKVRIRNLKIVGPEPVSAKPGEPVRVGSEFGH